MVCHQKIIWMVRWRVRQAVLAETRKKLEAIETHKTDRRGKGETDCSL